MMSVWPLPSPSRQHVQSRLFGSAIFEWYIAAEISSRRYKRPEIEKVAQYVACAVDEGELVGDFEHAAGSSSTCEVFRRRSSCAQTCLTRLACGSCKRSRWLHNVHVLLDGDTPSLYDALSLYCELVPAADHWCRAVVPGLDSLRGLDTTITQYENFMPLHAGLAALRGGGLSVNGTAAVLMKDLLPTPEPSVAFSCSDSKAKVYSVRTLAAIAEVALHPDFRPEYTLMAKKVCVEDTKRPQNLEMDFRAVVSRQGRDV